MPDKIDKLLETAVGLKNIKINGIAANFACFTGVMPTPKHINDLVTLADELSDKYGLSNLSISGGNSANIGMMLDGSHPRGVSNLRIGEGIICGRESLYRRPIPGCYQDAFVLKAEVIEVHEKPTLPGGKCAQSGFGEVKEFVDMGTRKQAILALGLEDTDEAALIPKLDGAVIVGASSNHIVLDVEDCTEDVRVGDIIGFDTLYPAIMRGMLSPYLRKVYVD